MVRFSCFVGNRGSWVLVGASNANVLDFDSSELDG